MSRIRYGHFDPEKSDGCTVLSWINKHILRRSELTYRHCCIEHDRAYWYGGTKKQRLVADQKLRDCVIAHTNKFWGWTVYYAVRIIGSPRLPFPTRWARHVTIIEGMMRGYRAGEN